ncbi:MAG: prolipoprotein diacylglyceryl transferase [Schleiferiaceae bacterium]|nr:prolipoprotein diacylglyceryl transferase [Schleiferiaceae bacterium]
MDLLTNFIWFESNHLVFNLHNSSQWYPILYQIAFFAGLLLFVSHGVKKQYPLSSWLIISASASLLLIVGSKLGTFSIEDWRLFFETGILEPTGKKTSLGAVLLIVVFLGLVVKAIRFKAPFWGAFAFFLPVVMLVQRVGCMMAGCCYGKPLASPGGVKYFGPSIIRDRQIHSETLPISEVITQPIHNVPLYFILVAIITVAVLLLVRKKVKNGEQLLLLSITLMLVGRFVVEFFRDPQAHNIPQNIIYGLTQQQWSFVGVFFILLYLFYRTSQNNPTQVSDNLPKVYPLRNLVMVLSLSVVMLLLSDWFTRYEQYVLYFQMTLAGLLNLKVVWAVERKLKPLVMPATLFVATAVVMAQEMPNFEIDSKSKTFVTSSYSNNQLHGVGYPCLMTAPGCFGDVCALSDSIRIHGPNYSSFQLGVEHDFGLKPNGYSNAIGADFGLESFYNSENNWRETYYHYSVYYKLNMRRSGLTIGFRNGSFFFPSYIENRGVYKIVPRLGWRIGTDASLLRFQLGVFDDYLPGGITPAFLNINTDIRLINNENFGLRSGFVVGPSDIGFESSNFYGFNLDMHFKNANLTIRPTFGVTVRDFPESNSSSLPQFAIQLRKGFSHKK